MAPKCTEMLQEKTSLSEAIDHVKLDRNLDRLMVDLVEKHKLPNAVTLVAKAGKICYCKGYGMQNKNLGIPVKESTLFRIYSMTKPVTSVGIMMLVEQGDLLLSQPIHLFLGDAWKKENLRVFVQGDNVDNYLTEPCKSNITVKMLLTHTSGLSYGLFGDHPIDMMYMQDKKLRQNRHNNVTLEDFIAEIPKHPLLAQPGTMWNYSFATDILGRIIEVVSGQSLEEFFSQRIFQPLRMEDTKFFLDPADENEMARLSDCYQYNLYTREMEFVSDKMHKNSENLKGKKLLSGGGGLLSTVGDYFQFAQMLLNGGAKDGQRLLSRRSLEFMTSNHLPGNVDMRSISLPGLYTEIAESHVGFGLGLSVVLDSVAAGTMASNGSFSWGGLANTIFWCDPVEQVVVVFMTQVLMLDRVRYPVRRLLENIVYGAVVDGELHQHQGLHASKL